MRSYERLGIQPLGVAGRTALIPTNISRSRKGVEVGKWREAGADPVQVQITYVYYVGPGLSSRL